MKRLLILIALTVSSAYGQAQWSLGYWAPHITGAPVSSIMWNALTHVAMVGGNPNSDGSITLTPSFSTNAPAIITAAHAHNVKVLYSVLSGDFNDSVTNHESTLIANIMSTVNTYGFDGVDIDYEEAWNATVVSTLISDMRTQLGTKILTATNTSVGNGSCNTGNTYTTTEVGMLDRMNLLTYDLNGTFEPETWFSSPLFSATGSLYSVDQDIKGAASCGYPKAKTGIGLPFYGYLQTPSNGPYQSFGVSPTLTQISWANMFSTYGFSITGGLAGSTYDSTAHEPWIAQSGTSWITWENTQSITDKINYIKTNSLGGWVIWLVGWDYLPSQTPATPLLNAVAAAMPVTQQQATATGTVISGNVSTINWNSVQQQITGFGTGITYTNDLTSGQADLLFTTSSGIGLSIVRGVIPSDNPTSGCPSSCATPTDVQNAASMVLAAARGATIWLTPFSAPAAYKSNGSVDNGGSLLTGSYAAYAGYLKNFAQFVASSNGITISYISEQNEPDITASYETMTWTDQTMHDFIVNNLAPTLVGSGIKIIMPESSGWDGLSSFNDVCVADSTCLGDISVLAAHDYDGASDAQNSFGKPLWMTEIADSNPTDLTIASGITYAQQIHALLTNANLNAWMYYEALPFPVSGSNNNLSLIEPGGNTKRLYTLGNFAKFARPGWFRIGATDNVAGLNISAYKSSNSTANSGGFAIVLINPNAGAVTITLSFSGFSCHSVTPNITDASNNLAAQTAVGGSGSSITVTVQGNQVMTLSGTAGT